MTEQYVIYVVKVLVNESENFETDMNSLSSVKEYGVGTVKMFEESIGE